MWHVVTTVGWDLFKGPAFLQALETGAGCVSQILGNLEAEIEALVQQALSDVVNAATYLAEAAALRVAKKFFENILNEGPDI